MALVLTIDNYGMSALERVPVEHIIACGLAGRSRLSIGQGRLSTRLGVAGVRFAIRSVASGGPLALRFGCIVVLESRI